MRTSSSSLFIRDHQAKLFALTAEDNPESYMDVLDVDDRRLELAKASLERVDVVGVQERFGDLLQELEERCGWRRTSVPDKNVAGGEPAGASASFRHRIAKDNRADMEFYEYARALCERPVRGRSHEPAGPLFLLPPPEDRRDHADQEDSR